MLKRPRARTFDGLTDKIEFTPTDSVLFSCAAVIFVTSSGDSTTPRILDDQASGVSGFRFIAANPDSGFQRMQFAWEWDTGGGEWATPNGGILSGNQYRVAVSYDGNLDTNAPTMFVDGVKETVSEPSSPSGTRQALSSTMRIGNRGNQDRSFDGEISELAIWNRLLSDAEGIAVTNGFSPLFFPEGLVFYAPLIRETLDYAGGVTLTLTGTTVATHPSTIYPARATVPIFVVTDQPQLRKQIFADMALRRARAANSAYWFATTKIQIPDVAPAVDPFIPSGGHMGTN